MTDIFYGSGIIPVSSLDDVQYVPLLPQLLVQILESEDGKVKGKMPTRAHPTDAGLDLYCVQSVVIPMQETVAVNTGICVKIPEGYAGLVCPRSGHARNLGITVANAPGIVDPAYTGELLVLLRNEGFAPVEFEAGTKVAQLVIVPILIPEIVEVSEMPQTDRAEKGFGSSG